MIFSFKPKRLLGLALAGGIAGVGLRLWLFAAGLDSQGLIRTEHFANSLTFILTAIVLAGTYLLLQLPKSKPTYQRLFPVSKPAAVGCWIAALGILITDYRELSAVQDNITMISFLLGLIAAACLVLLGLFRLRGTRPKLFLHACITAYLMIHVISQYRIWSAEPQLQNYGFQLLASVFLMLSAYHRTTLDADCGNHRWYLFFHCGALFFCCLAIVGGNPLFYLAMGLWTALSLFAAKPVSFPEEMVLPGNVLFCLQALEEAGYSAYVVGGCVRDALLGLTPQDYDMCTSATPEQIAEVFDQYPLLRKGEKHGTVGVVLEGNVYEITTFRTEGSYSDSRHPDWVNFVTDLNEDLSRRDFTVNAMAYSPAKGYIDPFGGQKDLKNHVLRTVGDPEARFQEDALRILRGMRFAARYALTPEAETERAMLDLSHLIAQLAPERVFSELCKLLPYVTAKDLIRYEPIVTAVIPELATAVGFDQHSPHHAYDVYTHTAYTVEATPPHLPLRLAALLHDVAKPTVFSQDENGRGHFYDHAKIGAQMADDILLCLRSSNALRNQVVFLIAHHMTPFEPDKKILRRRLGSYGEATVKDLLALQKADYSSKGVDEGEDTHFAQVETLLSEILQEDACLTVKELAVSGTDLLSLGVQPGKHIGECMKHLLNLVQDESIPNNKEDLLCAAEDFFANNREESV